MKLRNPTPATMFRKERPVKQRHRRICLVAETFDGNGKSNLAGGVCSDIEACESRQPKLDLGLSDER